MKLLHISLTAQTGGGPEHLYQLVRHLSSDKENFIALPKDGPYWKKCAELVGEDHLFAMPHRAFRWGSLRGLLRFINARRLDIIHSHGKGAGLYSRALAMLCGKPCVHTFHGVHLQYAQPLKTAYIWLERLLGSRTAACICVSEGEAALARSLGFCRAAALHVIPNGVDIPQECSAYRAEQPFRILHISRFDTAQKNSLFLLDIAAALRERHALQGMLFDVIGDGEEKESLEAQVQQAGFCEFFVFHGVQPQPRTFMRGTAAQGAAGCTLSTSRWEGLPLAVLESMSEGVPCVVSDVIGNRDAVTHGVNGLCYPLGQPEKAAESLMLLREQTNLRLRLGAAARETAAAQFSVQRMADTTAAVYAMLL